VRAIVFVGMVVVIFFAAIGLNSCNETNLLIQVAYADQAVMPYNYTANDEVIGENENGNNNALTTVINGRLKNDNFHPNALISESKIDSTIGWIRDKAGRFEQSEPFWKLRSQYGWKMMLNDSIIFDREFILFSDSTDTVSVFGNDSIHVYKDALFNGDVRTDSLISLKGLRISKSLITDSLSVTAGIIASRGIFDSIRVGSIAWATSLE
jgi:hypothetical protein